MKKFTVKDFLAYNNPCISCSESVSFYFSSIKKAEVPKKGPSAYISPIVSTQYIAVDLKKTYSHSLTLTIFNKTNKFKVNNFHELQSYISDNHISLTLTCLNCQSHVASKYLQFDLEGGYVKPTEISNESFNIKSKGKTYTIFTAFYDGKSQSEIRVYDNKNILDPFEISLPALPLYKFKNKNKLIEKIKTYMIFS